MPRAEDWYIRVYFPSGAKVELGWGYEYWKLDSSIYEGHDELKAMAAAHGQRWTKRQLAYELAENRQTDVLTAAGGVEHSIVALRAAIAKAQAWSDKNVPRTTPTPRFQGIGHDSVVDAWYEFANVLSWARALEERLDRRPPSRPRTAPLPRQGLLPALKPARLRKRVGNLVDDLRAGPVGESRFLANFTLHAALLRNPNTGARLVTGGRIILPIPDRQTGPISNWKLLTWSDHRDGITFAEELWTSVQTFIEALIEAFERAVPRRLRKPTS
jgi:hypothetical protein